MSPIKTLKCDLKNKMFRFKYTIQILDGFVPYQGSSSGLGPFLTFFGDLPFGFLFKGGHGVRVLYAWQICKRCPFCAECAHLNFTAT